jgi:peptide/nickel transport system substrate-binding protein
MKSCTRRTVLLQMFFVLSLLFSTSVDGLCQTKTLIIGAGAEPSDLLPGSSSIATMDRTYNIYEPLVWLNADAKPVPCLATQWEAIDNNKKWRFHLRKNVFFHNGEKFTAEDVAFSIDFTKNPENKLARRGRIAGYTSKVVDEYTIDVFREDGKPVDPILPLFWLPIQMISKNTVSKITLPKLAREPIGTGPFQFVEWRDGEQITLKANDRYWRGRPKIDRVVFKTIPEVATRVVALRAGNVDLISDVPPEEIKALEADPNLKILKKPSLQNLHLTLQTDRPPFKDNINLRKAVAHAVNVEEVCNIILGGNATPVSGLVPPLAFGYKEIKPYKYDPALAKEYLQKAGYKGEEITITSTVGRYYKDVEINTAVEMWLKAIGMKTNLKMYDSPTWISMFDSKKLDPVCLVLWTPRSGDGVENLFNAVHSSSASCFHGPKGIPGVDELIDLARTSFDPKVRKEAIEKAQEVIYDYAAFAMAYVPANIYGVRKSLKWSPRADATICISIEDDK